ncbi:hypothetical protein XaplCFBP3123_09840 [Xanthomonas arboricola pv. populi]|nr:hypothetical protein XaplCFBP3123_09840 [Xanthomonas arboricola pv. populi]
MPCRSRDAGPRPSLALDNPLRAAHTRIAPETRIPDAFPIPDSPIPNPQSPIPNPQSPLATPPPHARSCHVHPA